MKNKKNKRVFVQIRLIREMNSFGGIFSNLIYFTNCWIVDCHQFRIWIIYCSQNNNNCRLEKSDKIASCRNRRDTAWKWVVVNCVTFYRWYHLCEINVKMLTRTSHAHAKHLSTVFFGVNGLKWKTTNEHIQYALGILCLIVSCHNKRRKKYNNK